MENSDSSFYLAYKRKLLLPDLEIFDYGHLHGLKVKSLIFIYNNANQFYRL